MIRQVKTCSVLECPWLLEMWEIIEADADYLNIVRLIQKGKTKEEVKNLPVDGIEDYLDIWNLLSVLEDRDKTLLVYKNDNIVPPLGII